MKKIALIGDTHFARKAEHPLIKKYIKEGQLEFFDYLIAELKRQEVTTVLFTGDIHDTRNTINVEALINTKRLFQTKMADFDIHIILGNHDMYHENDVRSQEHDEVNSVRHTFPDTRPWGAPKSHFSTTRASAGAAETENRATGLGEPYRKMAGTASGLDGFAET